MKPEKKKTIHISKARYTSPVPGYVAFGHRHLEKEKPQPIATDGDERHFIIPTDLLSITLPTPLLEEIESMEMVYRQKGS